MQRNLTNLTDHRPVPEEKTYLLPILHGYYQLKLTPIISDVCYTESDKIENLNIFFNCFFIEITDINGVCK